MDRKILNIPKGYTVEKVEVLDDVIHINIRPYKRNIATCSGCGKKHRDGFHSSDKVKIRDMPISGRKVYLHVTKRKYRCPEKKGIYVEELAWAKKKGELPLALLKKFIV